LGGSDAAGGQRLQLGTLQRQALHGGADHLLHHEAGRRRARHHLEGHLAACVVGLGRPVRHQDGRPDAAPRGLLERRVAVGEAHLEVPLLQCRDEALPQGGVLAGHRHPAGSAATPELGPDDEDQQQREDEDEEDVRAVPQEAAQLHAGDRRDAPHAATPRSGTSRATTMATAANTSMVSTGAPMSPRPPPPDVIPSPRMNAPTGLRSSRVAAHPVLLTGKNAPPAMPSTMARIDCAIPACSAVLATRTTMNISDVVAVTAQTMRTATAAGEPKATPNSRPPTASSTEVATTPRMKLTRALAKTMLVGFMGIERSRARVPCSRSASRPSTPKPTVKSRNRPA